LQSWIAAEVKWLPPCEAPISVKCWMPLSEGRKDGDKSRVRCSA
jgi:hypothetical protein